MSARLASLPLAALHAWLRGPLVALALVAGVAHGVEPATSARGSTENRTPIMQLAALIADLGDVNRTVSAAELLAAYEKAYGSVAAVPARWPALVRRTLVCRETGDQACVQSSITAINKIGGVGAFPLDHLLEVSRFQMSVFSIRTRLQDAEHVVGTQALPKHGPIPDTSPAVRGKAAVAAVADPPPSANSTSAHNGPSATTAHAAPKPAAEKAATKLATKAAVKPAAPRSLMQRASARLQRLGGGDQSGFFLDALFVSVTVSLVLAYFLFAATRARKSASSGESLPVEELKKLEELRAEDKLQLEQALAHEKMTAEIAIDAQKTHTENLLEEAKHASEQALIAERLRAAKMIEDERLRVSEVIEAANARAEQEIEACARMAATELEKVQREIQELRQALQAEKLRSDAQELQTKEASQASAVFKEMEARLRDAIQMTAAELTKALKRIDVLQRTLDAEKQQRAALDVKQTEALEMIEALNASLSASESRLQEALLIQQTEKTAHAAENRKIAEKLKSAQLAAIALHKSLLAARALNADLERRADETMLAAELRIAEVRRLHAARPEQERGQDGKPSEKGPAAVASIASNDS